MWGIISIEHLIIGLLVLLCVALGVLLIRIRSNKEGYTRERFSFVALGAIVTLGSALIAGVTTGRMPSSFIGSIAGMVSGGGPPPAPPTGAESLLIVGAYIFTVWKIFGMHQHWDGLKSVAQYEREQIGSAPTMVREGIEEAKRVLQRSPPLAIYHTLDFRDYVTTLPEIVDPIAWRDQARMLVCLSSSSYEFHERDAWHDRQGCWIGRNVDTEDTVAIYPVASLPPQDELVRFVDYARRIANMHASRLSEAIVVVEDEEGQPFSAHPPETLSLIRIETQLSLLTRLVSLRDYRNDIKQRAEATLAESPLSLVDAYVPSRFSRHGEEDEDIESYLIKWLEEAGQRQLAVLGEYGQGKSTAALMFAYHLLLDPKHQGGRIPILIELRGSSPRNLEPLQLLATWGAKYHINPQGLMRLHIAGKLVLIFEGFDEMALVGDRDMRLRHFMTLCQFCYPKARILVTGRPNFFLDDEEMNVALGIGEPRANGPYCEALRLLPFNVEQIEGALRKQPIMIREQILAFARKNDRFRELVSRPSILHIVGALWEKERLFDKVQSLSSAFVIGLYIRHSFTRQGRKEGDSPAFMALNTPEREFFMKGTAAFMSAKELPNQIAARDLNILIERFISAIPDSVSTQGSTILGETPVPLRIRLQDGELPMEHVKTDVRTCGILVDDPAVPGTFRFGHKSFMEYLFAAVVAEIFSGKGDHGAGSIMRVTGAHASQVLQHAECVGFLAELLESTSIGIQRPSYAGSPEHERAVAAGLLRQIAGGSMHYVVARLVLWQVVVAVSFRQSGLLRVVAGLALLLPVAVMAVSILTRGDAVPERPGYPFNVLVLSMIIGMLPTMLLIVGTESMANDQFGLWAVLCTCLGIHDDAIHWAAGTSWIPWVNKTRVRDMVRGPSRSVLQELSLTTASEGQATGAEPPVTGAG